VFHMVGCLAWNSDYVWGMCAPLEDIYAHLFCVAVWMESEIKCHVQFWNWKGLGVAEKN